jgi:hypothetical protein
VEDLSRMLNNWCIKVEQVGMGKFKFIMTFSDRDVEFYDFSKNFYQHSPKNPLYCY